jgi:hypothetical protein
LVKPFSLEIVCAVVKALLPAFGHEHRAGRNGRHRRPSARASRSAASGCSIASPRGGQRDERQQPHHEEALSRFASTDRS